MRLDGIVTEAKIMSTGLQIIQGDFKVACPLDIVG